MRSVMKTNALAAFAALALLCVIGCARDGSDSKGAAKSDPAAGGLAAGHYLLTGEVVSVDPAHHTVRVSHEEVKGFMPAMMMDFSVSDGDAAQAKPGQRIRAELIPDKKNGFRLEKIWPDDKVSAETVAAGAQKLREDTHNRGKAAYREVGETVPDFALYDQSGAVVQSARFRGKQIMINFIFTRCPDATKCPAATAKMIAVQKLAREAGVANLELVSITLDAAYDTPGVLHDYAAARGIDKANFSFLTGPENGIKDLLTQFGVIAEFRGVLLVHTLTTLLVNENGKIVHRADGSVWEPQDFVKKMRNG